MMIIIIINCYYTLKQHRVLTTLCYKSEKCPHHVALKLHTKTSPYTLSNNNWGTQTLDMDAQNRGLGPTGRGKGWTGIGPNFHFYTQWIGYSVDRVL